MVTGEAALLPDRRLGLVEVEDVQGSRARFYRDHKPRFWARVPEGMEMPASNLRVWWDHPDGDFYLIEDAAPTVEEILDRRRPAEDVPEGPYINHCRMIGRIPKVGEEGGSPVIMPCSDKEALGRYVKERVFYFRVDSLMMPAHRAIFGDSR